MAHPASRSRPQLSDRFEFVGDSVSPPNREALQAALFEVVEVKTQKEYCLRLWRKTGGDIDNDLRALLHHEMRQVERLMSYSGAPNHVVRVLEFVEDDLEFGVLLEKRGHPLGTKLRRVPSHHWLKNLVGVRQRTLLWKNIKRLCKAIGIVHAQGLVHGGISLDSVVTEGSEEPDFLLSGFEWSIWVTSDPNASAVVSASVEHKRPSAYSFSDDWKSLGSLLVHLIGLRVDDDGVVNEVGAAGNVPLSALERRIFRKLIAPNRSEALDADVISADIDGIVYELSRTVTGRPGTLLLSFDGCRSLARVVFELSGGGIASDNIKAQVEFAAADLSNGFALLIPKYSKGRVDRLWLSSDALFYKLKPSLVNGVASWDIAICESVEVRGDDLPIRDYSEQALTHKVSCFPFNRLARSEATRLGPDVVDWAAFNSEDEGETDSSTKNIQQALLAIQVVEAVAKALEIFPIRIVRRREVDGQLYVSLVARPNTVRDAFSKKIGLGTVHENLHRIFAEEQGTADQKWRLSQSATLGGARVDEIDADFSAIDEFRGEPVYVFTVSSDPHDNVPLFLRMERDIGTEQVLKRRIRNINNLETRVDVAEFLSDPWFAKRTVGAALNKSDHHFSSLDDAKKAALEALWVTAPLYLVVGPPGVGKTHLATEIVRRKFSTDSSSRLIISAQGHDALDNLQEAVARALDQANLNDLIVVRTKTPDNRPATDEDISGVALDYLNDLSKSVAVQSALPQVRAAVKAALAEAERLNNASRKHRASAEIRAISSLILDAANIVITTLNSADMERLVEAKEQFDWSIIEEAAKATGPELIGAFSLSGRRLMIGDHYQLPPFDSDRVGEILQNHELLSQALAMAGELVGPIFYDSDLEGLIRRSKEPRQLAEIGSLALNLLQPFKTFVKDDESRAAGASGRRISSILNEQRRMHPAIARVVSEGFYGGALKTAEDREREAAKPLPFDTLPEFSSPIVFINFEHISKTTKAEGYEKARPRWINPLEADAVVRILKSLRSTEGVDGRPTLAVLSPYKAQVDLIKSRIDASLENDLGNLKGFSPAKRNSHFASTVDAFQGSEADIVVISLVRNNAKTGLSALGFLRDSRRMNVLMSRAKHKLVLIGSIEFLEEAVRGVNPSGGPHDLKFLREVTDIIRHLSSVESNGVKLANIIKADSLGVG